MKSRFLVGAAVPLPAGAAVALKYRAWDRWIVAGKIPGAQLRRIGARF